MKERRKLHLHSPGLSLVLVLEVGLLLRSLLLLLLLLLLLPKGVDLLIIVLCGNFDRPERR